MLAKRVTKNQTDALPRLSILFVCFFFVVITLFVGGLNWAGSSGGTAYALPCVPDDPLVIHPGPIGTPLRIVPFDSQSYLVADYSRNKILWFGEEGILSLFIETKGKPLSIGVNATFKKKGQLREAYYFIGNDDNRTIDVYYEDKKHQLTMTGQYPVDDDGIQALDMVFDKKHKVLYVVDGLDRDIKVVSPDGQLLNHFATGNVDFNPKGIAFDPDNELLYISDYGNLGQGVGSVKVFDTLGGQISESTINGDFSRPQGIAITPDKLFFVDNILDKVFEYDLETEALTNSYGCKGSSEAHLLLPMDVAVDPAGQSLLVADSRNMRITIIPLVQP